MNSPRGLDGNTCVIGLQWGDEAKGKLVDLLTPRFDLVVRYQGGANAGHTVVVGDATFKLHHIPSGILNSRVMSVVGPGVVVNPATLLKEIDTLRDRGVVIDHNLLLSDRAHVVFPWHIAEDQALNDSQVKGEGLGTTLRGIGPCYRDKVGRMYAIRLGDMLRPDFAALVQRVVEAKRRWLSGCGGDALDAAAIHQEYAHHAERLRPFVTDTTPLLLDAVEQGKRVLFEGAQGALLDIDHGTFPFVTSSNSSGVGVSAGSGVPGRWIHTTLGVIKVYSTRVGGGPFPTELFDATGEHIRERGREYGTTTGRPRRCGWFDAVAARYTARVSGADLLSAMMLDVLSGLPELRLCVAYEIGGRRVTQFPSHIDDLRQATPVYETLPGWSEDLTRARGGDDLPLNARRYLERISELVGCPIGIVSVGPDREQTIFLQGRASAAREDCRV